LRAERSIPIPWNDLTSQDGLEFDAVDTVDGSGVIATAMVLFDQWQAACTFDEARLALSCPNVPRTVSTITFSYGTRGVVGFTLWAHVNDDACDATYPPARYDALDALLCPVDHLLPIGRPPPPRRWTASSPSGDRLLLAGGPPPPHRETASSS